MFRLKTEPDNDPLFFKKSFKATPYKKGGYLKPIDARQRPNRQLLNVSI